MSSHINHSLASSAQIVRDIKARKQHWVDKSMSIIISATCNYKMSMRQQMKLSQIADHHRDSRTDQLYQPLRKAIEVPESRLRPNPNKMSNALFRSDMKRSQLEISGLQQHILKQNTLIPQNMRLVQTNNPLKRIKARSRSYRAISVQEKIGQPIQPQIFKQSMAANINKKKQIVYDYEPNSYQPGKQFKALMPISIDYKMPTRARSATYLGPVYQSLAQRVERVESKTIQIDRKLPTGPFSNTSIKLNELSTSNELKSRQIKTQKQIQKPKNTEQVSEYYQQVKRYNFNQDFKTSPRAVMQQKSIDQIGKWGPISPRRDSSYKYNLFSALDEQANTNCANGFCSKNDLIAPRIRQQW